MAVMTENKVVPKKRFSSFNSNWIMKWYGDIYSFYSTNSLSRDKLNYESGRVFNIHYGDIHTKFSTMFDLKKESTPLINLEVDLSKYSEEKYCQEGDLVIADASEDYADIGKTIELINLNNERVLAGLHTFLARPNKYEMAKGFAGYLIQSWNVRKQVMVIAQGSKVLSLATGRLAKIKLFIPEYQEQQKIASFFSAVDKKLQQLTKKKELLEEYKKGVMQKIFSQELRFKDDNGNNFPDWEEKRIEDLFIVTRGTVLAIPKISPHKNDECPYPVYSSQTKNNGIAGYYKDYLFEDAITWTTDGAQAGEVNLRKGKFYCTNVCGVLKSDEGYANLCIAEKLNRVSRRYVSYVGNPKLMNNVMAKIKISIPISLDEQQKIANFLSSLDSKIKLVSTQIENTKLFKKGLLQQLFV